MHNINLDKESIKKIGLKIYFGRLTSMYVPRKTNFIAIKKNGRATLKYGPIIAKSAVRLGILSFFLLILAKN